MSLSKQVKSNNLLAITHIDGSESAQTFTVETGRKFLILKNLKKLSGCSVVMNTWFNNPKELIVEKSEEAINFLVTIKLDAIDLNGKK
tara:strand:- start:44 stop:307 length:264 start_codon:yes stop_codon:yes gene_type:complete